MGPEQDMVPMASSAAYRNMQDAGCVKEDVVISGAGLQYMDQFKALVPHLAALHVFNSAYPDRLLYTFVQKIGHTAQVCSSSENYTNLRPPGNIPSLIRACNHGTSTRW